MKRFRSACLALVSVCCAGVGAVASRPQYGGTLRVETDATIRSIDPASPAADAAESAARGRLSSQVFEPLAAVDRDGLRPRLATAWEHERNGARWRFQLRSGVTLHDGTPLEAWKVAASLHASEPSWKVSPDTDAIVIEPDTPSLDLPWKLADSDHAIVVRGPGASLIGTGPFRLDRIGGTRINLRAHNTYWGGRPFVDAVQIDTGRRFDAQLADLEGGRADIVGVRAVDARRAARRGSRVEASNPLELVALVFESHRVGDATMSWRRTIASTLKRDAICSVVLQGRAAPARALLPQWLSGYASVVAPPVGATLSRAAVAALTPEMRDLTIRVENSDGVLQAIAERIAVDAREAGFAVKVQLPAGLAPRPDARIVRVPLASASPDRAFAQSAAGLTIRGWPVIAMPETTSLEATYRADQSLVDHLVVVPVVHLPELYGLGERVGFSARPIVNATGGWNLADAWVRGKS